MDRELVKALPVFVKVPEIQEDVVSKAEGDDGKKTTKQKVKNGSKKWTGFVPQTT